jgi:hypothetical protein
MTTHGPETGAAMDPTESLVRESFEAAVGDVQLDVASIVGAGVVAGRRQLRTRRLQQGVGAVAGVGVIAAAGLVGIQGDWFDNAAPPPAKHVHVHVTELVPSNPRALAAAVIAKLPAGWKTDHVDATTRPHAKDIGDHIGVKVNGQLVVLTPTGYPEGHLALSCAGRNQETGQRRETCTMVDLPHGGLLWLDTTTLYPGTKNANIGVTAMAKRSDGIITVMISQGGSGIRPGQAAAWTRLAKAIVTDPAVGFQTYQHFIDIQGSVPNYRPYQP